MLSYQKAAPQLREICERHSVPYVQQSVFRRLKKTADIMVGATSMRPFDREWEHGKDLFTWDDQKTNRAQAGTERGDFGNGGATFESESSNGGAAAPSAAPVDSVEAAKKAQG